MECPYCGNSFHPQWNEQKLGQRQDISHELIVLQQDCPSCKKLIVKLVEIERDFHISEGGSQQVVPQPPPDKVERNFWVVPPNKPPRNLPEEIPDELKNSFHDAEKVLEISPEASATMSRRCLQQLLREYAGVEESHLAQEIEEAMEQDRMPGYLKDEIDAVRKVGNFGAHPIIDREADKIVPIEDGEAEWLLDILEELFEIYIVRPQKVDEKRKNLNDKLENAGEYPMKTQDYIEGENG